MEQIKEKAGLEEKGRIESGVRIEEEERKVEEPKLLRSEGREEGVLLFDIIASPRSCARAKTSARDGCTKVIEIDPRRMREGVAVEADVLAGFRDCAHLRRSSRSKRPNIKSNRDARNGGRDVRVNSKEADARDVGKGSAQRDCVVIPSLETVAAALAALPTAETDRGEPDPPFPRKTASKEMLS